MARAINQDIQIQFFPAFRDDEEEFPACSIPYYTIRPEVVAEQETPPEVDYVIVAIAKTTFQFIYDFTLAVATSAYVTLTNAGRSFYRIVLLDLLRCRAIPLAVFRVAYWAFGIGICFITTIYREFKPQDQDQTLLKTYLDKELDPTHVQCRSVVIDVAHVPADTQVRKLLEMFDRINFDRPNDPGYISPARRMENRHQYSVQELRGYLQDFVTKVENREAFLGTPPAYDIARLDAFYGQIENAVRFTIHKVESELQAFQEQGAANPAQYRNLLENCAAVPLELAIAGNHCGARFMGDAMDIYYMNKGEASIAGLSLKDTITEQLSQKRLEIARGQIQEHLGADAHAFSNYMGTMGPILALPGTENIVEHLAAPIDVNHYTRLFCQQYTPDAIIDAVQEKYRTSQTFREKIFDWMKDHIPADWNQANINAALNGINQERVDAIRAQNQLNENDTTRLLQNQLPTLINFWRGAGQDLALRDDWIDFLFSVQNFPDLRILQGVNQMQRMQLRNLFNAQDAQGELLRNCLQRAFLQNQPFLIEDITAPLLQRQKEAEIRRLIPQGIQIADETIQRILRGEANLRETVLAGLQQKRGADFLGRLFPNAARGAIEELPAEAVEWILVSQGIFFPQGDI